MTQLPGAGRTMLFHAPYPVDTQDRTGSKVRPVKMLRAFEALGYDVLEVTGHGAERGRALRRVDQALRGGTRIDFGYGENATLPTVLTEPHHLPTHPVVDLRLLRLLRRHQVPTSLFYRDIYWRFPEYTTRVNPVLAVGTRSLYHAELLVYARWLDRVYLPSAQIAAQVPHLRADRVAPLPPGAAVVDRPRPARRPGEPLTVLYVGNLSSYYRVHHLLAAVGQVSGVRLLLCTPEQAWAATQQEYAPWLTAAGGRIEVVHRQGEGLAELFDRADVASLVVEPSPYRDFAAPVKLYEYLGYGTPVLASAGTLAGRTVADEGAGWSVEYRPEALTALLTRLRDDPGEVARAAEVVRSVRHRHTWTTRARTVAQDLAGLDNRPVS